MRVLVKSKTNFNATELSGVSNIAYDGTNYTITYTGGTKVYPVNAYFISILF